MLTKTFLKHPHEVGETYPEHLCAAFSFGTAMLLGGLACLVHGLVPALFRSTGSGVVRELHRRMVLGRRPAAPSAIDWVI